MYTGIYNNKTVAVKTLKGNVTEQQVAAFKVELEIMRFVFLYIMLTCFQLCQVRLSGSLLWCLCGYGSAKFGHGIL